MHVQLRTSTSKGLGAVVEATLEYSGTGSGIVLPLFF